MLYHQNSGGSAQLENLEREYFVAFPKCNKLVDLQSHLAQWVQLKKKFGVGLPMEHLIAMMWKILPDEIRDDLKNQNDLRGNLDLQLNYLYGEFGDSMDEKLSKWNLTKLQQQLRYKSKNTTGLNVIGAQQPSEAPVPAASPVVPTAADLADMMDQMKQFVNAVNPRGRTIQRTPQGSRRWIKWFAKRSPPDI